MPVQGDLGTMALADLLQWIGVTRKTGLLEIERNGQIKRIEFRKGLIGACSSDDRESQLGQYLIARKKINPSQLEDATRIMRERSGLRLGSVLVDMGLLTEKDVTRFVAANVEVTIQALFDWEDADFRFHEGATFDPCGVEVNLPVSDILLRGIQYQDEIKMFREAFPSSGVVLRRTDLPSPGQLLEREMTRRIFEAIDGERTIAQLLRVSHASDLLVLKFLYRLHQLGLVKVHAERPVTDDTLLDRQAPARPTLASQASDASSAEDRPDDTERLSGYTDKQVETDAARRLLARKEFGAALELLHATFRAYPGDFELGNLLCEAEIGFVGSAGIASLSPTSVPIRAESDDAPGRHLESEESFLLSLIDGNFDVQSILSLATLREEDVLRTLDQMLDKGLIALRPGPAGDAIDAALA